MTLASSGAADLDRLGDALGRVSTRPARSPSLCYAPGGTLVDTETVAVSGNGTYTTPTGYTLPTTGTVTGTYQWDATYSGDANNNPVGQHQAATNRWWSARPVPVDHHDRPARRRDARTTPARRR